MAVAKMIRAFVSVAALTALYTRSKHYSRHESTFYAVAAKALALQAVRSGTSRALGWADNCGTDAQNLKFSQCQSRDHVTLLPRAHKMGDNPSLSSLTSLE